MKRSTGGRVLPAALLLCLFLGGCAGAKAPEEALPAEKAPTETQAGPAPTAATDGLEGGYYNDFLRETLTLDGAGGASLADASGVRAGRYEAAGGMLDISLPGERLRGQTGPGGDLTIEGRRGWFLRDWAFWGITAAEAGRHPVAALPDTETIALGGGAFRFRDYENRIAFTCGGGMALAAAQPAGAAAATDGQGGYVVGRNVTETYLTRSGSSGEFLEDYVKSAVFADFAALYGPVEALEDFCLPGETAEGRLGTGELRLIGGENDIAVRVLLFVSAYADGTENYLCKSVFAPAGAPEQMEALFRGVTDMAAARAVAR